VLEGFKAAAQWDSDLVLSLNFSPPLLNDDEAGMDHFVSMVRDHGLDPSRIVIEVLESQVLDLGRLKRFCNLQQSLGFLIALDDIGTGYSNLDRISELKPDLIKTDRSLLMDIEKNHHKREVFKSIVELTHSLGAMVVAEGAETEMEAMLALELGADMIQGYYFSRPAEMTSELLNCCEEKIDEASRKFKSHVIQSINTKKAQYKLYDRMVSVMAGELATTTPKAYDARLFEMLERHPEAECLFILDEAGTQMSRMVSLGAPSPRKHLFYKALARGADHSLKDYFYMLIKSDFKGYTYVTAPYVSPVTGKLCVTVSTLFNNGYGRTNVLCVDVNAEALPV
jgi:EAL domain-containing protein (putative c-di-GMP-specific phosphodiesterase class I)